MEKIASLWEVDALIVGKHIPDGDGVEIAQTVYKLRETPEYKALVREADTLRKKLLAQMKNQSDKYKELET